MERLIEVPALVEAIIPAKQLIFIKSNILEYSDEMRHLEKLLSECPKLGETDTMVVSEVREHPCMFHYFFGSSDFFICEYDGKNEMFGFTILNGDLENSEWGYLRKSELFKIKYLDIDLHIKEQSIEAALYTMYPNYYKKPQSLGVIV